MNNTLFGSKRIVDGYANDRPWLHKLVIEQIKAYFAGGIPFQSSLDVGCGAGLSTKVMTEEEVYEWMQETLSPISRAETNSCF